MAGFYGPVRVESHSCPEVIDIVPNWESVTPCMQGGKLAMAQCKVEQYTACLTIPRPDSDKLNPYHAWNREQRRVVKQAIYSMIAEERRQELQLWKENQRKEAARNRVKNGLPPNREEEREMLADQRHQKIDYPMKPCLDPGQTQLYNRGTYELRLVWDQGRMAYISPYAWYLPPTLPPVSTQHGMVPTYDWDDPLPNPYEEDPAEPPTYMQITSSLDFGDIPRIFRCRSGIPQWQYQPGPLTNLYKEDRPPSYGRDEHYSRSQLRRRSASIQSRPPQRPDMRTDQSQGRRPHYQDSGWKDMKPKSEHL